MSRAVEGPKLRPNVTLLVGPRFKIGMDEHTDEVLRGGMGLTIVVDRIPVAGPIYLFEGLEGGCKVAECHNCGKQGGFGKKVDTARRWAHEHRCDPENVWARVRACRQ